MLTLGQVRMHENHAVMGAQQQQQPPPPPPPPLLLSADLNKQLDDPINNHQSHRISLNTANANFCRGSEFSPSPNSEISNTANTTTTTTSTTNTSRFHSLHNQANYCTNSLLPTVCFSSNNNNLSNSTHSNRSNLAAQYRHSSASIDHKSLNLGKFHDHQLNQLAANHRAQALNPTIGSHQLFSVDDPNRSEHLANFVISSARRSQSFRRALEPINSIFNQQFEWNANNSGPACAFNRSISCRHHHQHDHYLNNQQHLQHTLKLVADNSNNLLHNNSSSINLRPFRRHLSTPPVAPPRPPEGFDATKRDHSLQSSLHCHSTQANNSTTPTPIINQAPNLTGRLDGPQTLAASDSLDNIQMIVDEENPSYAASFQAAPATVELGTIRMAPQKSANSAHIQESGRRTRSSKSPTSALDESWRQSSCVVKFKAELCQFDDGGDVEAVGRGRNEAPRDVNCLPIRHSSSEQNSSSSSTRNVLKDVEQVVRFDDLTTSNRQSSSSQLEPQLEPLIESRSATFPLESTNDDNQRQQFGQTIDSNRNTDQYRQPNCSYIFSEVRKYSEYL